MCILIVLVATQDEKLYSSEHADRTVILRKSNSSYERPAVAWITNESGAPGNSELCNPPRTKPGEVLSLRGAAASSECTYPTVVYAFEDAHKIPHSVDLVYHNVSDLEAGHLVFDRDHQFETIEPIRAEIVAEPRFVRQPFKIDSEMPGDNLADLDGEAVVHGHSL
jgi:hypothetical protein